MTFNIYAMYACSKNMKIGYNKTSNPGKWTSNEDKMFVSDIVSKLKPIILMGGNTYRSLNKKFKSPLVLLSNSSKYGINENNDKFEILNNDPMQISTKFDLMIDSKNQENIKKLIDIIKIHFYPKNNLLIMGGPTIIELFMDFYMSFWITVENNIIIDNGISAFNGVDNVVQSIEYMKSKNMHIEAIIEKNVNTKIYQFSRK